MEARESYCSENFIDPLLAHDIHTGHTSRLLFTGNINDQRLYACYAYNV